MTPSVLIKLSKEFGIVVKFNADRISPTWAIFRTQVYSRAQLLDHINPDSFVTELLTAILKTCAEKLVKNW